MGSCTCAEEPTPRHPQRLSSSIPSCRQNFQPTEQFSNSVMALILEKQAVDCGSQGLAGSQAGARPAGAQSP